MAGTDTYLAKERQGIVQPLTFAGANTARVQQVIDLITPSYTESVSRLYLDQMSPACKSSLLTILVALKAALTDV